jgi:hypothetical protein
MTLFLSKSHPKTRCISPITFSPLVMKAAAAVDTDSKLRSSFIPIRVSLPQRPATRLSTSQISWSGAWKVMTYPGSCAPFCNWQKADAACVQRQRECRHVFGFFLLFLFFTSSPILLSGKCNSLDSVFNISKKTTPAIALERKASFGVTTTTASRTLQR